MNWFVVGGLLLIVVLIVLATLSYRKKSAETEDFLEKHYEEFDAD